MLATTRQALTAILNADPSITMDQKRSFRVVFDGSSVQGGQIPRVIRREEAAQLLSVSVKRVDQLSRDGTLRRVQVPGTARAIGIAEDSLRNLISGTACVQNGGRA